MERKAARGVPAEMVHRWNRAPLSCRLCRAKKLRCDRAQPCSNCVQRKADCEYAADAPHFSVKRSEAARPKPATKQEQLLPSKEPFHPS